MADINQIIFFAAIAGGALLGLQAILCIITMVTLRSASRDRSQLSKELFGLVKRLEGMTSGRREQMLKHYDGILEDISLRLPPTIAAQAGGMIIEAEGKILARLAELEPNLNEDKDGRKKMDELVRSMEKLEETIVAITADTVRQVMTDTRKNLLSLDDLSMAA